jgi:4-diphosphocytidyl-2-C-methyl-D-erythritol kinase
MSIQAEPGFKVREACAKINITLEVTGKRDDGYHQISSVMQAINLRDTLSIRQADHLYLDSNVTTLVSPNNLVYRAARLLQDITGVARGAAISLGKNIPLASGLGGGSSDAVATIQTLNDIWELNLTPDNLERIAAQLGSDTLFFLAGGGTALAGGRGDKITRLPSLPQAYVVLMNPDMNIPNKTSSMYASLDPSHFTHGEATQKIIEMLRRGEQITVSDCYNVFEKVAFSRFTELEEYRRCFLSAGAEEVRLAGAGPTLFTLAENQDHGLEIYHQLEKEGLEVYLAKTL